jgi:putative endopeptidase
MNDLLKYVDKSTRLQDDFYYFVNGKWMLETTIPDDKPSWSSFMVLRENSINQVKNLLESSDFDDEDFKKIQLFYKAGMDIVRRNELDYTPIKIYLDKIKAINSVSDVVEVLNVLAKNNLASIFGCVSEIDRKETSREVPHIFSSGLSLPSLYSTSKDYYLEADKQPVRDKYLEFMTNIFNFINYPNPQSSAERLLKFETKLAEKHYSQVQKRDPELTYNSINISELAKYSNTINWINYFKNFTSVDINKVVVDNIDFIKLVNEILTSDHLEDWKIYLTGRLINSSSPYLSERFIDNSFDFYGKIISGSKTLEENSKRVLDLISQRNIIGELVGKYYVQKYFAGESKSKIVGLVSNLLESMKERIKSLDWMSETTKEKALNKLKHFNVKVGYPDVWEDYSSLKFSESDSYFDIINKCVSHIRYLSFENLYQKPNPNKWGMSPQTVNAYYSPYRNEIVFPAGILQFPFFDKSMSDAENYGGIGAVIGHEITHGFDDKGSKFDFDGNMIDWWTQEDSLKFKEKGNYIVSEYEKFLVNGKPLNGQLTLGENIADHGGIKIALQALQVNYAKKGKNEDDSELKSDQKFFYSWARIWRSKRRSELDEQLRMTDPHAHPEARVNVTLANITEFHKNFDIKEGDKLYRKDIPNIW